MNKISKNLFVLRKVYEHYRYLKPFAKRNRAKGAGSGFMPITVFAEPRGGSTWLGEIFNKLPQSLLVSEPMFLIPGYKELKKVDFTFNQYIPENTEWPEAEEFFGKLFNMQVHSLSSLRIYFHNKTLKNIADTKYVIYKDVNSNMLLPWITSKFQINPVYLIRHPCAVIASQLKYKHWDYIQKDVRAYFPVTYARHNDLFEEFSDIISDIRTPEERMAAEWAIHNIVPLRHPANDSRWITVAYEKLLTDPEHELIRVFNRLGVEMPESILSEISTPSMTTVQSSRENILSGNQLGSWKHYLRKDQVKTIIKTINRFGISFYDESPEPDYSSLFVR
ncbi:MAG: sulfotransferase [Bacteroidetes bacterium]|nr:sulfotransferase [Bacteroidota bacterium]